MPKTKKPTIAQLPALLTELIHTPFLIGQVPALEALDDMHSADKLRGASILALSLRDFLDGTYTEADVRTIFTLAPLRPGVPPATTDTTPDAPSHA